MRKISGLFFGLLLFFSAPSVDLLGEKNEWGEQGSVEDEVGLIDDEELLSDEEIIEEPIDDVAEPVEETVEVVEEDSDVVLEDEPVEVVSEEPKPEETASQETEEAPHDGGAIEKPEGVVEVLPTITTKMAWQFIEDELLLLPGYASSFLFPAKCLGAVGAISSLAQTKKFKCWVSKTSREFKFLKLLSFRSWLETVKGKVWNDKPFSGFTTKLLFAIGALAGYKLTNWVIETFLYGFALRKFLLQYPKINRAKTPQALHQYFDKEYDAFIKGGTSYIIWRTKKVVCFVEKAVKMYKKGVKFTV